MWHFEYNQPLMAKDDLPRLRSVPLDEPLNIVLLEPEIPQNTGNIARMAAATASRLHLIGPLGFRTDERAVRRAGLDYWHLVDLCQHDSLEGFVASRPDARLRLFSSTGKKSFLDADLRPGDALVFGRESVGLPESLLDIHAEHTYGIPTLGPVRSLNLANSVAIVLYEALRRLGALEHPTLQSVSSRC